MPTWPSPARSGSRESALSAVGLLEHGAMSPIAAAFLLSHDDLRRRREAVTLTGNSARGRSREVP